MSIRLETLPTLVKKTPPLNRKNTPRKATMTMEHQPFENVSPIKSCDFPLSY